MSRRPKTSTNVSKKTFISLLRAETTDSKDGLMDSSARQKLSKWCFSSKGIETTGGHPSYPGQHPEEEDAIHETPLLLGRILGGAGVPLPKGEHPQIRLHPPEIPSSTPYYEVAKEWLRIARGIPKDTSGHPGTISVVKPTS